MRVLTLNIHKGYTALNGRFMLHELKHAICEVGADLVFLQEVQGEHRGRALREDRWPPLAQYEFLADQVWNEFAYGKNAAYQHGHHGNALLSHYPIVQWRQVDISTNAIEQRGFLHCEIDVPGAGRIHSICVHRYRSLSPATPTTGRACPRASLRRNWISWTRTNMFAAAAHGRSRHSRRC